MQTDGFFARRKQQAQADVMGLFLFYPLDWLTSADVHATLPLRWARVVQALHALVDAGLLEAEFRGPPSKRGHRRRYYRAVVSPARVKPSPRYGNTP